MIQITINGYSFNELSEDAKKRAINDHIEFWCECRGYDSENKGNFEKAVDEAERMRTPWFVGSYIAEYCMDEIIEELEINGYVFDIDGDIIPRRYVYE